MRQKEIQLSCTSLNLAAPVSHLQFSQYFSVPTYRETSWP